MKQKVNATIQKSTNHLNTTNRNISPFQWEIFAFTFS